MFAVNLAAMQIGANMIIKNIIYFVTLLIPSTLKTTTCFLLGAAAVLLPSTAKAAMIINAYQSGLDVGIDFSGSIDDLSTNISRIPGSANLLPNSLRPGSVLVLNTRVSSAFTNNPSSASADICVFTNSSATTTYGYAGQTLATSATGSLFGFNFGANRPLLSQNYSVGATLSGTHLYSNKTLAELGLSGGNSYPLTARVNNINVNILETLAPLPILGIPASPGLLP